MIKRNILEIKNLTVSLNDKIILSNLNLNINENEIHIIMGPNGAGKSTLVKLLVGHPSYKIKEGQILYLKKNLSDILPINRVHKGMFLGFQSPYEIPGITNYDFLKLIYNQHLRYKNKKEIKSLEFIKIIKILLTKLNLQSEFLTKNVNQNLSGGEKKSNEILQMLLLNPKLIILDEIDSGLDLDSIKIIFSDILKNKIKRSSILLITHNPKIISYLNPTYIHILRNGKFIQTGDMTLLDSIINKGYTNF